MVTDKKSALALIVDGLVSKKISVLSTGAILSAKISPHLHFRASLSERRRLVSASGGTGGRLRVALAVRRAGGRWPGRPGRSEPLGQSGQPHGSRFLLPHDEEQEQRQSLQRGRGAEKVGEGCAPSVDARRHHGKQPENPSETKEKEEQHAHSQLPHCHHVALSHRVDGQVLRPTARHPVHNDAKNLRAKKVLK